VIRYLIIISLVFLAGCATDAITTVKRNEKGKIVSIHTRQRFARFIPALGKSEADVETGKVKLNSAALPDIDLRKD